MSDTTKSEIVYINGRPVRKTEKITVDYDYQALETTFAGCDNLLDAISTAIASGIPFTLKSPGVPSKGSVQDLWRLLLYTEKTKKFEAYTQKGLCHQLALEEVALPPVTIQKALNEDYRNKETQELKSMIEQAEKDGQEALTAIKQELRAAEDAVSFGERQPLSAGDGSVDFQ